jgi:hypothetical protein
MSGRRRALTAYSQYAPITPAMWPALLRICPAGSTVVAELPTDLGRACLEGHIRTAVYEKIAAG